MSVPKLKGCLWRETIFLHVLIDCIKDMGRDNQEDKPLSSSKKLLLKCAPDFGDCNASVLKVLTPMEGDNSLDWDNLNAAIRSDAAFQSQV